jgi:hypothetical protein
MIFVFIQMKFEGLRTTILASAHLTGAICTASVFALFAGTSTLRIFHKIHILLFKVIYKTLKKQKRCIFYERIFESNKFHSERLFLQQS